MVSTQTRRCLTIALLSLVALGCGRDDDDGLTRVAVIGETPKLVETVTGPLSVGDALMRANMAQGLVRFDERGQVVPGLAERWNVSDDGLSYIFRLQTGDWPDGRKISAEDVAIILSRQLRPSSTNPLKDTLGAVTEIVAMTDRVIEIRLASPRPNLLQLLAQPELGVVRAGAGTGPFRFPTPDETANPAPAAEEEDGTLLLVHRIVIPDEKDPVESVRLSGGAPAKLIAAFAGGSIDLLLGGTVADLPLALKAKVPRGALRFDPVTGLFGLMPTARSEVLQEPEVRQLLSRAIDRQALVAGLRVEGLTPRATVLQAGLQGMGAPVQPQWLSLPVEERRALLTAEADRLFGDTERPKLRISVPEGPGGAFLLARLRFDWAPLGIGAERAEGPKSADLVLIDEVAPSNSPAWFLRRFRCGVAAICLEEVEPLLAAARAAPIADQRNALLAEAARMIDEGQLFIPITAPIRWSLVSGRVPGFAENPFARHTLVGLADPRMSGYSR